MHRTVTVLLLCFCVWAVPAAQARPAASVAQRMLFGKRSLAAMGGEQSPGEAQAFRFASNSRGQAAAIRVYVGPRSRARRLMLGLYSGGQNPTARLAAGSVSRVQPGVWNTVKIKPVPIQKGKSYWLAVLGRGGTLFLRYRTGVTCRSRMSKQHALTSLPARWSTGASRNACALSGYVMGRKSKSGIGGGGSTNGGSSSGAPTGLGNPIGIGTVPLRNEDCFVEPSACGSPDPTASYPSASYVGPENGTTSVPCSSLTPASGTVTLAASGETYSNVDLNGRIIVRAPNVTIDSVCVTYNGDGQVNSGPAVEFEATNGTIENSVIAGANATTQSTEIALGENVNTGYTLTADHDYIYNCGECVHNDGWTVENSYVITNGTPCQDGYSGSTCEGGDDHFEDVYCDTGSDAITHNTLLNPNSQTAVVFCNTNNGVTGEPCANHLSITDNLMAGGGFILYSCGNASSAGGSTLSFTNNHIGRCLRTPLTYQPSTGGWTCSTTNYAGADSYGYWPYGGYFGIDLGTYCPGTPGVTWSGNVWDDDGQTLSCKS